MKRPLKMAITSIIALYFAFNCLCQSNSIIPEFYGIYVVVGGKPIEMQDALVQRRLKEQKSFPSSTVGIISLSSLQASSDSYFLLYGRGYVSQADSICLYSLEYRSTLQQTDFFSNKVSSVAFNAWIAKKKIPVRIGPVRGYNDLLKMVPSTPLEKGAYCLTFDGFAAGGMAMQDVVQFGFVNDFYIGDKPSTPTLAASSEISSPEFEQSSQIPNANAGQTSIAQTGAQNENEDFSKAKSLEDLADHFSISASLAYELTVSSSEQSLWNAIEDCVKPTILRKGNDIQYENREIGLFLTRPASNIIGQNEWKWFHIIQVVKKSSNEYTIRVLQPNYIRTLPGGSWHIGPDEDYIKTWSRKFAEKIKKETEKSK